MMVPTRPHKDHLGKAPCEAGIARKSKMKRRENADEKGTRWQHSGMKRKIGDDLGTKKDGRKLLAVGGHAKGTGAGGA